MNEKVDWIKGLSRKLALAMIAEGITSMDIMPMRTDEQEYEISVKVKEVRAR